MTAICKTIAVHGDHLSHLLDYGSDSEKTMLHENDALANLISYASNETKTSFVNPLDQETSLLVTGVQCSPDSLSWKMSPEHGTVKPILKQGNYSKMLTMD